MLVDQSLADFTSAAAAKQPTPGGGAIAAALLALGASMGEMAARYSEGRDGAEAVPDEIAALATLRARGLALVDADAEVFAGVGAAYAMPRDDDEQKALRKAAIKAALGTALGPPREACALALEGLDLLQSLETHANPNLISDVGVAAYALGAAARSAWLNVLVNIRGIDKGAPRDAALAEGATLLADVARLEQEVGEKIVARITP